MKRWNLHSLPPHVPACLCSFYSITDNAAITLKGVVEFAAFLSETGVFAYLGLQVWYAVGGLSARTLLNSTAASWLLWRAACQVLHWASHKVLRVAVLSLCDTLLASL